MVTAGLLKTGDASDKLFYVKNDSAKFGVTIKFNNYFFSFSTICFPRVKRKWILSGQQI